MKKHILILITYLILFSCKSDSSEVKKQNEVDVSNGLNNEFVVKLNFKTNKSDNFKMVLYNIIPDEYQSKYIVINERVVLTSEMDVFIANFGNNISNSFRINFGNKEEKVIEISSVELSYGQNKINISPEDFSNYFTFNDYVFQDPKTLNIKTLKVEDKLQPIIYLKPQYLKQLQNENK